MKSRSRSNLLLVEILIAILFFMLASRVLVQLFASAHRQSVRSGVEAAALSEAQNVADTVAAAEDADAALEEMGFGSYHGVWTRSYGDYTLMVDCGSVEAGEGALRQGEVKAFYGRGEEIISLPYARYEEVRS